MNLYWPIYKRLEEEVVKLAFSIHFNDDQIDVYSTHIADLIVRCVVEIEALSKTLYEQLGGVMNPVDKDGNSRSLYFDTDCMALLNQKWRLDKKRITIFASNFYFEDDKNKHLFPLHKSGKRGTSGSKWKQAYQDLKHDRYKNLKKATVGNLINALGALYILNLYYKDEYYYLGSAFNPNPFENNCGSEVFRAEFFIAIDFEWKEKADDGCIRKLPEDNIDWSIYLLKIRDEEFKQLHLDWCVEQKCTQLNFNTDPSVRNVLALRPELRGKSVKDVCMAIGGKAFYDRIKSRYRETKLRFTNREAKLNKDNQVYPNIGFRSDEEINKPFMQTSEYRKMCRLNGELPQF